MKCELSYTVNIHAIEKAESLGIDPPEVIEGFSPFIIDIDVIKAATLTECKECINLFALNDRFTIKYSEDIWQRLEEKLS